MSAMSDDWWAGGLSDELCATCGNKPSRSVGHGRHVCLACFESWWCQKCGCSMGKNHVCPTPDEKAALEQEWADFFTEIKG